MAADNNFNVSTTDMGNGMNHNGERGQWRMWNNRPYFFRQNPIIVVTATISPDAAILQNLSAIVTQLLNNLNTGCLISNDQKNQALIAQALTTLNSSSFQNAANQQTLLTEFTQLKTLADYMAANGCDATTIQQQLNLLVQARTDLYNMYNMRQPLAVPYNY